MLSLSCYFSNTDLLDKVLKKGAEINAVDKDGNNALMLLLIHDRSKDYEDNDDDEEDSSEELDSEDELPENM